MQSTISDRALTSTIFNTFAATNTEPPAAVQAARERMTTISAAYDNRPHPGHGNALALAIIAAIESGEIDPAADPEVQRILAQRQLPEAGDGVQTELAAHLRSTIADNVDDVLAIWRGPFDAAAKALQKAHDVLGPVDLTDTDLIVRAGAKHAAAWGEAQAAIATIDTIQNGWIMLRTFLAGQLTPKAGRLPVIVAVSPDDWIAKGLDGVPADPWTALGHGLDLRLASLVEFRQFGDDLGRARQQHADDAQAAAKAADRATRFRVPTSPEAA